MQKALPDLVPGSAMTSGLWLIPHEAGFAPDFELPILISPGLETSIVLEATLRSRLSAPFSNCTAQEELEHESAAGYAYSQHYCIDVCSQLQMIDACNLGRNCPVYRL